MYVCASKLGQALDIGGFVLRGAMVGIEDEHKARAPGRERIASYEITRNVPDDIWLRWFGQNANGPIVQRGLVMGFADNGDDTELNAWCWAHTHVRGWRQASQGSSSL